MKFKKKNNLFLLGTKRNKKEQKGTKKEQKRNKKEQKGTKIT